ncbi:hypothetical protein EDD69_11547 [Thermolongibacillus altinsuensis]|uniref:Uncharacterized protein n=1 Tax=Thermolongibacillus altinsuensis TaxID=575256 RepID=A0A4R1QJJ3_9BACL|nr:hypothetical protein EDD69_11547 [Thermolongibacillus altinsuensis]GMB09890.1 hypothetical protein B1no1_26000 [Thermolongibacillus altinsuensis]
MVEVFSAPIEYVSGDPHYITKVDTEVYAGHICSCASSRFSIVALGSRKMVKRWEFSPTFL